MMLALVLVLQGNPDSLALRVRQLADSFVTAYFERHPDEATLDGVANGPHDRLPDNSPDAIARWQAREDAWVAQLRRINPRRIEGRPEAVAYGIMRDAIEGSVATRVCRFELWSVAQTGGGWLPTITALATLQGVGTEEARRQTLARWRAVPAYIATEMANHRDGLRRGYTAPRHNVELALRQLDTLLATPLTAIRSFGTSDVARLLERLRSDTAYTFHTRDEMLARARDALARAQHAIPAYFGRLPRAPIVVEPYPAFRERQSVGEWNPPAEDGSRPGIYYLSTYDPRHKSRADLEPLSFHETIPGHHLQGTIALERGDAIPATARYFWSPGMGEGWAEYAEQLADELGLYSSDTARFGMLADITLSAALLVVDTGIHAFGWTREQAIDYIREHTHVPLLRAEVGVDRYPVWPAQGLSYGLGRLEIRRLRALALQRLGKRFDIREFHDRVLENGAVPLPMLRAAIERWIDASR